MTKAHDQRRSRRVLRLIAAERIIRGVLLLGAGVYLLFHVNSDFGRGAERVLRAVDLDPRRPLFHRLIAYLHHLHASEVRIAALFALSYGGLELVEGTGLWLDQLWAEYLVIATSLLIPLELYELVRHPTALKAGGLVVNLAIVAYLVRLLRRRRRGSSLATQPVFRSTRLDRGVPRGLLPTSRRGRALAFCRAQPM